IWLLFMSRTKMSRISTSVSVLKPHAATKLFTIQTLITLVITSIKYEEVVAIGYTKKVTKPTNTK
ncbi:hypothetical protein DD592_27965, partial [Enterobacter cloacae complex sp. 2DZ2F20B]